MIDLLVLVKALVKVRFAGAARPEHIPIVALRVTKSISLQNRANQLGVTLKNLVQQFPAVESVRPLSIVQSRRCIC